ncbi:HAMP domain-containing sensor histidine kinase [Streptomyces sp. NPDC094149]|uniref:sensor histidine kinase n=1 Tax=Streptomyces sp. NPDC094149 TaxID=3155079 RepID=UPI00331D9306
MRLTIAYTLITLLGLSCLCWLVIRTENGSRRAAEYDEMRRRATVAVSLIYYQNDRIQLDGLYDDEVTSGTPRLTVLHKASDGSLRVLFTGRSHRLAMSASELVDVGGTAMRADRMVRAEGHDLSGRAVYILAVPFYHDTTQNITGAVVAVGDPQRGWADHRRLVVSLLGGTAALTALAALTGHLLSGRSMRPAWSSLEQQEQLLGDAAHELRTPVAVMRGAVDIAESSPHGLNDHVPRIRRATDRMSDVVENLLTRGRLQAGADALRMSPMRLDQLVEQICGDLSPGEYRLEVETEESVITADAALVGVAVRNLLDNAVRHGRSLEMDGGQAPALVRVVVRGPEVWVADRGPGIDPDQLPELLLRFRSPSGGTGIGLSLVQRIAVAHRGGITVRRRYGGGTVFVLRLAPPTRAGGRRHRAQSGGRKPWTRLAYRRR